MTYNWRRLMPLAAVQGIETEDDNNVFTSVSTGHAVSVRQTLPPRLCNKHLIFPAITKCHGRK